MSELIWSCPVCGENLMPIGKSLKCPRNHCFDKARSGYVNLMPVQRKHAKIPGDNPEMIRARRDFLSRQYYKNLRDALTGRIQAYLPQNPDSVILDAGCGEGYYTSAVSVYAGDCYGVDISRSAADFASRIDKHTQYAVGSVFHLPVRTQSCDLVLNIFAPYCHEEFLRVLKPDGLLIRIIPAAKHLWEFKQAVYDKPYENQVKDYALEQFAFLERTEVRDRIFLDSPEDIQNLFRMTPYAYRTGAQEREKLQNLETLETQTAFEILIYRKI